MSYNTRADQQKIEELRLAPYALRSTTSDGRRVSEPPHPLRTAFQRDRDRVIHSRAFRRLEYKTQVFVTGTNDHFRTRLTHTIEVAGITRTLARVLGLNEDLAETIALAHDLGHTPFGHCGERELNRLLEDNGGFDHNLQALRVVDDLEVKYPHFPGLNLTWETRAGLMKHRRPGMMLDDTELPPQPSLESQTADLADDITYLAHDIDDGISAGLLTGDDLAGLHVWQLAKAQAHDLPESEDDATHFPYIVRHLINMLVAHVSEVSQQHLVDSGITTATEAQHYPTRLIDFEGELGKDCRELRKFMYKKVYWHPEVDADNQRAVTWMRDLYHHYLANPTDMGRKAQARLPRVGLTMTVADYLAGMTDRYAVEEYNRLVATPDAQVTL